MTTTPENGTEVPTEDARLDEVEVAELNAVVVRNIKGELKRKGYTYDQFAPKAGLTRGTFAQRMARNTAISLPELEAIAAALDLEPSKLLND